MEHIRETLEQFEDKHPIWWWVLVRLAICICWMFAAIAALIALVAAAAPFCGAIIGVWVLVPVFITACWGLVSLALWLYAEFVESW